MSDRFLVENSENLERVVQTVLARISNNVKNAPRQRGRNYLEEVPVTTTTESDYTGDFATYINDDGNIVVKPGTVIAGYLEKQSNETIFPMQYLVNIWVVALALEGVRDFSVSVVNSLPSSGYYYYEKIATIRSGKVTQIWKYGNVRVVDRWV